MPNLLLTMWDTIKSSNIGILAAAGLGMFAIIGGLSMLSYHYTLSGIKSRTVGDGQHGTARWATDKEIRKTYVHVLLGKHADTGNVVRNQTAHAGDSAVLTSMYSAMRRS